jgi:hypothetical protein
MSATSPLCSVCTDILNRQNLSQSLPDLPIRHHLDFASFQDAVRSECYICTIIWNCHFKDNKSATLKRLRGMGWCWQEEEREEGVVSFLIEVYLKGSADYVPKRVMFRLVDCGGIVFVDFFLSPT